MTWCVKGFFNIRLFKNLYRMLVSSNVNIYKAVLLGIMVWFTESSCGKEPSTQLKIDPFNAHSTNTCQFKYWTLALTGGLRWLEGSPTLKGCSFSPCQGTNLGCRSNPRLGTCMRSNQSVFLPTPSEKQWKNDLRWRLKNNSKKELCLLVLHFKGNSFYYVMCAF